VCTIVARNYLPQARVLASSFAQQHPDGRFVVLVIDDVGREVQGEPFEVWRLEDLDLEVAELRRMAAIYDLMALATALKPWFLEGLLASGRDTVIYLDPDIRLYSPLDEIVALARRSSIVLTPHLTAPIRVDGRRVTETDILGSGIYNLGFIALGAGSSSFLTFWKERLKRDCYVDHERQRFVDQRWVDLAPGMFDCSILQSARYNVAYWNLGHRQLDWNGTTYTVDGQPLGFFHFSGFNPRRPYILSKHQGERPRILLSERPALAKICEEYRQALDEKGFGDTSPSKYPFDLLPNGIVLNERLRTLYRLWLAELAEEGNPPPPDPFSLEGAEAFAVHLTSPGEGSRLPTYLHWEWAHRPDLQKEFPRPDGADYERYLFWAKEEVFYERLHPRLVQWSETAQGDAEYPADLIPGICVAGYLRAELGTGEAGRLVLDTVQRAGVESGTFVYRRTNSRQNHAIGELPRNDLNVNLIAINGDQMPQFGAEVGPSFFEGRYNIGFWAWELEEPPRGFYQGLPYLDEIWTVSEFSRASIARMTDKPVYTFPYPISRRLPSEELDRASLGLPEGFIFLFCFDLFSVSERKNPEGLIQAFKAAFEPGEGPTLVIKAINGKFKLADLERLRYEVRDRPDILIIDRYFDADENVALMVACDCYVSLHRSEGFGLTMAEAMVLGKPVIATGYSGNLDFMNEENSYLVPWNLSEVPPGCDPYPAGDHWAEPDLAVAATLMRRVVEDPDKAAAVSSRGEESISKTHAFATAVPFVRERFRHAQAVLASGPASWLPGAGDGDASDDVGSRDLEAPNLVTLRSLAASPAPVDGPSAHPAVASVVRRVVRRAIAHEEVHRQKVELALAEAVGTLVGQVETLSLHLDKLAAADEQRDHIVADVAKRLGSLESRLDAAEFRP